MIDQLITTLQRRLPSAMTIANPIVRRLRNLRAAPGSPAGGGTISLSTIMGDVQHRQLPARFLYLFIALCLCVPPAMGSDSASYRYDSLGRLSAVKSPTGSTMTYGYDPVGNRTNSQLLVSDPAKLTTGDAMTDWLVNGLVGTVPTQASPMSGTNLLASSSIGISSDDSLLWIDTTASLSPSGTEYDTIALQTANNFSQQASYSSGTTTFAEGVSALTVPGADLTLNAVNTGAGTNHAFIPSSSTSAGTPTSLAAANVFACLSPNGSTAAFALANNTVSLSGISDNFGSITTTFAISSTPLSITFDSAGTSLWISYPGSSVVEQYNLSGTLLQSFDVGSVRPSYNFLRSSGNYLVISSKTDSEIICVNTSVPAVASTINLGTIAPNELVLKGNTGYALGLDSANNHYKVVRFAVNSTSSVALDTGLSSPCAGLAVNSTETHAYTVSGAAPTTTCDLLLPTVVIPSGVAYVTGLRTVVSQASQYLTPSTDTYQFLQADGTSRFDSVANGGAQPTDTGLLISKVVTNSFGVSSIAELAPTAPLITSLLTNTHIFVGNSSNHAADVPVSGDASISNSGALTVTKTNGVPFAPSATIDTTNASNISSGTLPSARLPNPSATTLGGIESAAQQPHQWIDSISTSGVPHQSQPSVSDVSGAQSDALTNAHILVGNSSNIAADVAVSGDANMSNSGSMTVTKTNGTAFAPSATTDTTNASNITSGTLPAAQLPNPSASALGGVESASAQSHEWIDSISTSGVPHLSQPIFSDISGGLSAAQMPSLPSANIYIGNNSSQPAAQSLSGDATISAGGALTIAASAVANSKMANMPNNTVKGNVSGASAAPSDLTAPQLTTLVNTFTSSLSGAVPASGGGTSNFLRADGTWAAPSGGAVSSVSNSDGTLTISPTTGDVVASIATNVSLPGSPTTTTPPANDNSTKIATTAFVGNAFTNAGFSVSASFTEYGITTPASEPYGICQGSDGNLYGSEEGGNKVFKMTSGGSFTEYSIPTPSSFAKAICQGSDGNLYGVEEGGNKVFKMTSGGSFTEFNIPTSVSEPFSICQGTDGNLYGTEFNAGRVFKMTTGGSFTEYIIPTSGSEPDAICQGSDGNLYGAEFNGNKVFKMTTGGSFTEYNIPTSSSFPFSICQGSDGNLYGVEVTANKVFKMTASGSFTEYSIPTSDSQTYAICQGTDGNLYGVEESSNKVFKMTPGGSFTEYIIPTSGSEPDAICQGTDGNLYGTEFNGNKVFKMAPVQLLDITNGGTGATFLAPHGVLIGEGTAAIAASGTGSAGQPLVSNGSSADPTYQTLPVGGGGTGNTTLLSGAYLKGAGTSPITTQATPIPVADGGTGITTASPATVFSGPINNASGAAASSTAPSFRSISPTDIPISRNDCRVTLTSGTPVTASDVTGATTVYVTPYGGNLITTYNTTQNAWITQTFSQASFAVPATTSQMYDVFVQSASNSTITVSVLAWTNDTTRATSLTLLNGRYVLSSDNSKLYVGSFRTTATSGQTEDSVARRLVWNEYNRVTRRLLAQDPTASWTYASATVRASDNNTTDGQGRFSFIIGVQEDIIPVALDQQALSTGTGRTFCAGIGIDSTSGFTESKETWWSTAASSYYATLTVNYPVSAVPGYHFIQALESAPAAAQVTVYGTNAGAQNSWLSGTIRN